MIRTKKKVENIFSIKYKIEIYTLVLNLVANYLNKNNKIFFDNDDNDTRRNEFFYKKENNIY